MAWGAAGLANDRPVASDLAACRSLAVERALAAERLNTGRNLLEFRSTSHWPEGPHRA